MRLFFLALICCTVFASCGRKANQVLVSPPSDPSAVSVPTPQAPPPPRPTYDTPPADAVERRAERDYDLPPDPETVMDTSGELEVKRRTDPNQTVTAKARTEAERQATIEKQEAAILAQRQATLDAVSLKRKSAGAETLFSLTKTPCYGKCEEYKLEVLDNGVLRLRGRKNTKLIGEFYSQPIGYKYDELIGAYEKFINSNPAEVYPKDAEPPSDISSTVLGYKNDKDKEQEITVYYGEPEAFTELMELAQSLLDTQRWEK